MIGGGPRILVDASAVPAERGGVGRYVDGLVGGLASLGVDLAVVCQASDAERYGEVAPAARIVPGPASIARRPTRLVWEQTGLPRVAERIGARVIHSPHYTMPLRAGRPVVVTLHDATFFTTPALHTQVKGHFFRTATRTAVRLAARCVVPSAATRDELVRVAGADREQVDVCPHGVDTTTFRPPDETERRRVAERLGLGDTPWIAFLGTQEPRKNLPNLVRAWVEACGNRPDAPALVLAGGAGWEAALDGVAALVPSHLRLVRPGYVPIEDVAGLLGGALAVVYPSLGEGFGLPVLEAMACGTPVLTTRRLALPEVGGEAVAYTEPDVISIASALTALLDAPERRADLGRAGLLRARGFSWEASAMAHLAAYTAVLAA